MTFDHDETTPIEGFAPPTDAGVPYRPEGGSSWPKVIGVIAIVLGSLAAVGSLCGAFLPLLMDKFASMLPKDTAEQMQAAQVDQAYTILSSIAAMCLGVLLLVAGIGLVKHRRWAVKTTAVWAVLKIIYALGASWIGYTVQQEVMEELQQDPDFPGMPAGYTEMLTVFAIVFGVLWYSALPVFMLIWFSRRKIKDEVALWS